MKIISYSDIHLEFKKDLQAPAKSDADLMILSGDIINLRYPEPLETFLTGWEKPVLFVPGNHEYYTERPMNIEDEFFKLWLETMLPNVRLLLDEAITIKGVNFFGGTMWTDFADGDEAAMSEAQRCMNDFRLIRTEDNRTLTPADTLPLHEAFKKKLLEWFDTPLDGPRVVITHHAPILHPQSIHKGSALTPAFNSLDMVEVIEKFQPDFWFYGHTHECDRQAIGKTRIISNQLGYEGRHGYYECTEKFDENGAPVTIDSVQTDKSRKSYKS